MNTESKGIYHWKLGDVALARVSQKTYARVRVVKDEKGLFYDDKVLGISGNEDGTITVTKELCYYVETCRTNHRFWLPYTSLHLAERSRPFYGTEKVSNTTNKVAKAQVSPDKSSAIPQKSPIKSNIEKDDTNSFEIVRTGEEDLDLEDSSSSGDEKETKKRKIKYDVTFKDYIRRGKEIIFDQYFEMLKKIPEKEKFLNSLVNMKGKTDEKFELVTKSAVSEKEMENYWRNCWRYHFVHKSFYESDDDDVDSDSSTEDPRSIHTTWCIVCGKDDIDELQDCDACPAAYHPDCKRDWIPAMIHRKSSPTKVDTKPRIKRETVVKKILSGTRTICKVYEDKAHLDNSDISDDSDDSDLCPSCKWGPKVGYNDIVWNKLDTCSWWPARVLSPEQVPPCLQAKPHAADDLPIRYYGTLNHRWASPRRTCLFLACHTAVLDAKEGDLKQAVMDAHDDYIAVYLT